MSAGMVMCASKDDKLELVRPPAGSKVGDRVQLEGIAELASEYQPVLNPKKKFEVKILEAIGTNANKEVNCGEGKRLMINKACLHSDTLANANVS
jgi:aminoacyl tRNA synthase complex-interacting multifunctional protein 1